MRILADARRLDEAAALAREMQRGYPAHAPFYEAEIRSLRALGRVDASCEAARRAERLGARPPGYVPADCAEDS